MTAPVKPAKGRKEPMVQRNLRVKVAAWDEAAQHGAAEDPPRGVSDIVRDLLDGYNAAQRRRKARRS